MTDHEYDRHFARCWAQVASDGVFRSAVVPGLQSPVVADQMDETELRKAAEALAKHLLGKR